MRDYQRQEAEVRRLIRRPMARAVRLTNDALRLGVRIVQSQDSHPTTAAKAMFFLTTRLLNDVRACEMLAQSGYPIQSLAMAASAFELAYRALYVGKTDERADEWGRHTDLRYSYPRYLKQTMRTVYREWGEPEADADRMYGGRYQPIAAAKHANPRALAQFGIQQAGDTLHIFLGPVHEKATTRACQMALVECIRLLGMVLGNLVTRHLPHEDGETFFKPLRELLRRVAALGKALQ